MSLAAHFVLICGESKMLIWQLSLPEAMWESFHRKYSCCSAHTLQKSLFPSLTPLVALGSVKCEYDPGPHPLQQEGSRPEPRQRARVHSRWRKRPVPVPELRPGPGRLSGPLWLVRITVLKPPSLCLCDLHPFIHPCFLFPGGCVTPTRFVEGSRCGSTPLTTMFSTSS